MPISKKIIPKIKYQDRISGLCGANTWLISSSEYPSLAISFLISPSGTPERRDFLNSFNLASVSMINRGEGFRPMSPKDMQMNDFLTYTLSPQRREDAKFRKGLSCVLASRPLCPRVFAVKQQ